MCALRAHNNKPILEKIYWELKKLFSIPNKTFPKMDLLMCALRAHINRTHKVINKRTEKLWLEEQPDKTIRQV